MTVEEKNQRERRHDALDKCYLHVRRFHEFGEIVRDFVEEIEMYESIPVEKIEFFNKCMNSVSGKADQVAQVIIGIKEAMRKKRAT